MKLKIGKAPLITMKAKQDFIPSDNENMAKSC
jgi:hypothetical protein